MSLVLALLGAPRAALGFRTDLVLENLALTEELGDLAVILSAAARLCSIVPSSLTKP